MSTELGHTTVVLATDACYIGDGLAALLADDPDLEVIGRTDNLDDLFCIAERLRPQVAIVSVRSQVVTTTALIAAVRRLRTLHPETGIVIISDRLEGFALELLRGGSSGMAFLVDDHLPCFDLIVTALREVTAGRSALGPSVVDYLILRGDGSNADEFTPRQIDILEQLPQGLSEALRITVKYIEKGITAVFVKLGPFSNPGNRQSDAEP
jgi:DNA-binding NarL/FixJ family response regulator